MQFSLVRLQGMALVALVISSFPLPLDLLPFPSSSKFYGEMVVLASVPSSLLMVRLGFGSYLESGETLFRIMCCPFHCY